MPLAVAWDIRERHGVDDAGLRFVGRERSRADKGHVSPEDVPKLGQLVHRRLAKHPAYRGHAWVVFFCLHGIFRAIRVRDHRSKLEAPEMLAALTHPFLGEENRTAIPELDRERDEYAEGRREQKPRC